MLRVEVLAARRRLGPDRLAAAATRVRAALRDHLPELLPSHAGPDGPTAASYVPVGAEPGGPDLPEVLHGALPPGSRLLLPVLRDDLDLDWAAHDHDLRPTHRGLSEPTGPRLGPAAIADAALLVVPALAVDGRGIRLGRGGGSYDRALARVGPGATVVALLHDGELRDQPLPAESHDRPVNAAVAPSSGLVWLSS
jgi:5-formyltetrahydrofolate cyclo-ligase